MSEQNIKDKNDYINHGRSRMRGEFAGPGGKCICPHCACVVTHAAGEPCNQKKCPRCGEKMIRE